jgi:tRNA pseudouridine13 synthase
VDVPAEPSLVLPAAWPWPWRTAEVAAVPLRAKARLEDFVVDEIPRETACGTGDHAFVRIEKHGLATLDAIDLLARALGVPARDVGYAGLKDKEGVTRQTLSFEHVDESAVRALDLPGVRVLSVEKHSRKLRRGWLVGNRFDLKLRDVPAERLRDVRRVLGILELHGMPNYFGPQRFGGAGDNAELALRLLAGEARLPRVPGGRARLRFLVSALQSWLFNEIVAARLGEPDSLVPGETVLDHRDFRFRPARDGDAERIAALELSATGPLPGTGDARRWRGSHPAEAAVLARHARAVAALTRKGPFTWEGGRRALRVPVRELALESGDDAHGEFVRLSFVLPAGAYASVVVGEIGKEAAALGAVDSG